MTSFSLISNKITRWWKVIETSCSLWMTKSQKKTQNSLVWHQIYSTSLRNKVFCCLSQSILTYIHILIICQINILMHQTNRNHQQRPWRRDVKWIRKFRKLFSVPEHVCGLVFLLMKVDGKFVVSADFKFGIYQIKVTNFEKQFFMTFSRIFQSKWWIVFHRKKSFP